MKTSTNAPLQQVLEIIESPTPDLSLFTESLNTLDLNREQLRSIFKPLLDKRRPLAEKGEATEIIDKMLATVYSQYYNKYNILPPFKIKGVLENLNLPYILINNLLTQEDRSIDIIDDIKKILALKDIGTLSEEQIKMLMQAVAPSTSPFHSLLPQDQEIILLLNETLYHSREQYIIPPQAHSILHEATKINALQLTTEEVTTLVWSAYKKAYNLNIPPEKLSSYIYTTIDEHKDLTPEEIQVALKDTIAKIPSKIMQKANQKSLTQAITDGNTTEFTKLLETFPFHKSYKVEKLVSQLMKHHLKDHVLTPAGRHLMLRLFSAYSVATKNPEMEIVGYDVADLNVLQNIALSSQLTDIQKQLLAHVWLHGQGAPLPPPEFLTQLSQDTAFTVTEQNFPYIVKPLSIFIEKLIKHEQERLATSTDKTFERWSESTVHRLIEFIKQVFTAIKYNLPIEHKEERSFAHKIKQEALEATQQPSHPGPTK